MARSRNQGWYKELKQGSGKDNAVPRLVFPAATVNFDKAAVHQTGRLCEVLYRKSRDAQVRILTVSSVGTSGTSGASTATGAASGTASPVGQPLS